MNYRHAYHAGNFADVMKHAALALIIQYLNRKPKPYRVIDTHAGTGIYQLQGSEAMRTGEWQAGIGRVLAAIERQQISTEALDLLSPYLTTLGQPGEDGALACYPGSPVIARALMRAGDRLVANELHPDDFRVLSQHFSGDRQVRVLNQDAWTVLKAALPPQERRGVILVDPPFEEVGELERLVTGLNEAARKFATGIYLLWYPLKDPIEAEAFGQAIAGTGLKRLLQATLSIRRPGPGRHSAKALYGSGLIIHNPPYGLDRALETLFSELATVMAGDAEAAAEVRWLRGED